MARHAVALRRFTHGEERFEGFLPDMEDGRFAAWDGILVRAATSEEIALHFGATETGLTVAEYVDSFTGVAAPLDEADLQLQQFAADHASEIEQEIARRAEQVAARSEQQRAKRR